MSGKFLDDYELSITCPKCGHKFKEKAGRFNSNPNVTCPSCRQLITIDIKGFNSGVNDIEKIAEEGWVQTPVAFQLIQSNFYFRGGYKL